MARMGMEKVNFSPIISNSEKRFVEPFIERSIEFVIRVGAGTEP
jgi:hypothetical protein